MQIVAILIKHEVCVLEDVWPYLRNSDGSFDKAEEEHDEIERLLNKQT